MSSPNTNRPDPVTPESVYFNRRLFLKAAVMGASVVATGGIYRLFNHKPRGGSPPPPPPTSTPVGVSAAPPAGNAPWAITEPRTSFEDITHYNNFYEFTTDKEEVAGAAAGFDTTGWKVTIDGLVRKPLVLDMKSLQALAPAEERTYRMRCVEAWSMVIPWLGLPLAKVLEAVEPKPEAKYVAFETLHDPVRMPGQRTSVLEWPYVEGLRLDEAMHPLTLLATGLYGRPLPAQDGAPVRLVVPWKYGFKGIKSIVRISLVEKQPATSWNRYAPGEYGFYANVNPAVDHPRWSQATEQRIGESGRRKTLPFNGYGEMVASLYEGMDLRANF